MRRKILVIDDEMVMRSLIAISMQRNGYAVANVDNSFQALDYLDTATPDLIILDILMPGMNGIDLCRRIRSRPATKNTPIVIFSALGDETTIKNAFAAGASRYLHKINLFGDLIKLVENTLAEPSAPRFHHQSDQPAVAAAFDKPAV